MRKGRRFWSAVLFWVLAIAWIGVLFFFSGQNAEDSSGLSTRFTQLLLRMFPILKMPAGELEAILRKAAHFGIFAVEGFLLSTALMETFPKRMVEMGCLTSLLCAVVAVANELHEKTAVGRSCSVVDMLIDTGGAAVGVLFAMLLFRVAERKRS